MSERPMDSSGADDSTADIDAVRSVAMDYAAGWYAGDADRMARALHDNLAKRTVTSDAPGGLRPVTKTRMVELTAAGGGGGEVVEPVVFVDAVTVDMASVRVETPHFVDFLHLAKTAEGWQIVNVLFRMPG